MQEPLHKVKEERCHSLNRIYGLFARHKLDSKYITPEVDYTATMVPRAKVNTGLSCSRTDAH